ncbi:MAG TPA: hypothetical protein VGL54_07985 [Solirubrobacteraceae bacterium]
MANRTRGRSGRSRKRRSTATRSEGKRQRGQLTAELAAERPTGRTAAGGRDPLSVGERPQAPWHPLPLSELLILVGAIGAAFGLIRLSHGGISHGGPALFAGIAAVLIGTVEVTLREHLSGYRSHTLLLTLLPVLVFHSATILVVSSLTTVPTLLNVGLLIVDVGLGTILFKVLRARFLDARRERMFAGRR